MYENYNSYFLLLPQLNRLIDDNIRSKVNPQIRGTLSLREIILSFRKFEIQRASRDYCLVILFASFWLAEPNDPFNWLGSL